MKKLKFDFVGFFYVTEDEIMLLWRNPFDNIFPIFVNMRCLMLLNYTSSHSVVA